MQLQHHRRSSHRNISIQYRILGTKRYAGRIPKSHRQNFIQPTKNIQFSGRYYYRSGGGLQNRKEKLFKCLYRLNEENLAINANKCHFAKNKITCLGYEIDQKIIKPIVSRTQAILNLKPPSSHKQLKSFLGSVHHLTKFIPNLAPLCHEFKNLLQKDTKYVWTNHHHTKCENKNKFLRNLTENTHYDTKRRTRVKTDTSSNLHLEQRTCNGWETISYASRSLNKAEEKYSINNLELLGVVWALNRVVWALRVIY